MIPKRYWLGVLLFVGAVYFVARSGTTERTPWPKWALTAPVPVLCVELRHGRCRAVQALWPVDDRHWVTPSVSPQAPVDVLWRRPLACARRLASGGWAPLWSLWDCPTVERPWMEPATWEDLIPGQAIAGYGLRDTAWQEIPLTVVTWEYRDARWWLIVQPTAPGLLPGTPVWTVPAQRLIGLALPPGRAGEDWAVWVTSPHLTMEPATP
ncbi:MAG: hypothetical protein NZ742_01640 [Acidobacteria bacterium]|nr:hypothetical protein [Acidobacteriota bacterium]MDW7983553.1 hypothetical protein [Acidobacteriota bacterium]